MTQIKSNYEAKVTELTSWVELLLKHKTSLTPENANFREKEGMMEYVYQYDNLQKQLQLLQ